MPRSIVQCRMGCIGTFLHTSSCLVHCMVPMEGGRGEGGREGGRGEGGREGGREGRGREGGREGETSNNIHDVSFKFVNCISLYIYTIDSWVS